MASAMAVDTRRRPSSTHGPRELSPTADLMIPELHLGTFSHLAIPNFEPKHGSLPLQSSPAPGARRTLSALLAEQSPSTLEPSVPESASPLADGATPVHADDLLLDDIPFIDPSFDRSDAEPMVESPQPVPPLPEVAQRTSSPNYAALPPGAAPASTFVGGQLGHGPRKSSSGSNLLNGTVPVNSSPDPSRLSPTNQLHHLTPSAQPSTEMPLNHQPVHAMSSTSTSPALQPIGGPRHPAMLSARSPASGKRTAPVPASAPPPRTFAPVPGVAGVPGVLSLQELIANETPIPIAQSPPPRKREEEVCIECMMRDRDMADVDVTSPGVWARESDADYIDLIRREQEEEERHAMGQGSSSSHSSRPRVRSRGGKLTEENVRKWLMMNPKDHEARWRTLTKYVKAQSILMQAEMAARLRAEAEQRSVDPQMRDAHARQSTHEADGASLRARGVATNGANGLALNASTGYFSPRFDVDNESLPATPGRVLANAEAKTLVPERDTVLLENGATRDKVNMREQGMATRSRSRGRTRTGAGSRDERLSVYDRASVYSTPSGRQFPVSLGESPCPSPPLSGPGAQANGVGVPRAQSQISMDGAVRRSRFFGGWRQSLAGSMVSLAPSRASVVNLHGMDMDRERFAHSTSTPALLDRPIQEHEWPPQAKAGSADEAEPPANVQQAKKKKGIGRLFKIFAGGKQSHSQQNRPVATQPTRAEDDLSTPLPPPPSMTYLVSRTSGEWQSTHSRALSTPSMVSGAPSQARSLLVSPLPMAQTRPSPPTAPSSVLPSPTSVRFSWRGSNLSVDKLTAQERLEFPSLGTALEDVETHDTAAFEAELRRRHLLQAPVINSSRTNLTPGSSPRTARPLTIMMTDKTLPPLPPEAAVDDRVRRQSFAGIGEAQTASTVQERTSSTMGRAAGSRAPTAGRAPISGRPSRDSLGPHDGMPSMRRGSADAGQTESKRRSRFGLSALMGRKDKDKRAQTEPAMAVASYDAYPAPVIFRGSADMFDQGRREPNGIVRPATAGFVPQDEQYVAYRYPSESDAVDLRSLRTR